MAAAGGAIRDLEIPGGLIAAHVPPKPIVGKTIATRRRFRPNFAPFEHWIWCRVGNEREAALPCLVPANCPVQHIIVRGASGDAKYVHEVWPAQIRRIQKQQPLKS